MVANGVCVLDLRCLWIAVKFMETPLTIIDKSIKKILQQRRHSGNVSMHHATL